MYNFAKFKMEMHELKSYTQNKQAYTFQSEIWHMYLQP